MTLAEAFAIFAGGIAAGAINTVVGSGTLITFPLLLGFGYDPVIANVSNTIGLVPGSLSGAIGYRRELSGQSRRLLRLGTASVLGGVTGAVLLLVLPAAAFDFIVPVFIAGALVLVAVQPRISAALAARRGMHAAHEGLPTLLALFVLGVYGGYFGAAQGILLLAVLGLALPEGLQRINGVKNVLAMLVNGVAALVFMGVADVSWPVAGLIAAGAVIGGQIGSRFGRRLHPTALRVLIVLVGLSAIARLLLG